MCCGREARVGCVRAIDAFSALRSKQKSSWFKSNMLYSEHICEELKEKMWL